MKKIMLFLMVGMFLISLGSALTIDNTKYSRQTTFDGKSILGNKLLEKYNPIEIKNGFGLNIPFIYRGKTLFEGYISSHTETCGIDCSSTIEIKLNEAGILIEDFKSETLQKDGSWTIDPLRNYQFYIKKNESTYYVDDFQWQCTPNGIISSNGTEGQNCRNVKIGRHLEKSPIWKKYTLGDILPIGIYKIKLDAEKSPFKTVDWKIKVKGKWLNEWATWVSELDEVSTIMTTSSGSASQTSRFGIRFETKNNTNLKNVTKWSGVTCTTAYLYNRTGVAAGTVLSTKTFSGDNATFDYSLIAGNQYFLTCDAGGGSYTSHWDTRTFPFDTGNITVHSRVDIGTDESTANARNIKSFVTEFQGGEIKLNSPADGSQEGSLNILFNTTARIFGGATIVNMSLYHNDTGTWALNETRIHNTTNEAPTGISLYLSASTTEETRGIGFDMNINASSAIFYKNSGSDATNCNLRNSGGGLLVSSTFSENACTIDYDLVEGTHYRITINSGGSAYNLYHDQTSISFPYTSTNGYVNFTSGYNSLGNVDLGTWYSLENITLIPEGFYDLSSPATIVFNKSIDNLGIIWNVETCDSDGVCAFAPSNFSLNLDGILPLINLTAPDGLIDYGLSGASETLNWNVSDDNLDSCWYDYNGTNQSLTCTDNTTTFILETNNLNLTFYANDTVGNQHSNFTNWTYKIFEESRNFNTTTFETESETFSTNLTSNSSLTSVILDYNGTNYTLTQSGTNWSTTFDIPTGNLQNNSIRWNFIYGSETIVSPDFNQNVSETVFTLCNSSYTNDFLNISFKDEDDLSVINASIPTSNFVYYLGSGLVNKTYSYSNTTNNLNYTFCATPTDRSLNVDSYVQYKQGSDYPQRIWDAAVQVYTSTVTEQILYLLSSLDGIFVTFTVQSQSGNVLENVAVEGSRQISGSPVTIAQGATGGSGSVTFWLNPDFEHNFTFSKAGISDFNLILFPTLSSYTIVMGSGSTGTTITDINKGVSFTTEPFGDFLLNDTIYNFNYTLSSNFWTLDSWGFTLKYGNGSTIGTQTSTASTGGILNLNANTTNETKIIMEYFYEINNTYNNFTRAWNIETANAYSINNFFNRVSTYINANLFGILGDDNGQFSKALISVMILILTSGLLVSRYGLVSEAAIMGIITGILIFLNTINLLPNTGLFENAIIPFGDFLVYITLIISVSFIIREERT